MKDKKFEACFENVTESVVLISNGQIEYVNQSFLENFEEQIEKCEAPEVMIEVKKENFFQRFKSLFYKKQHVETVP